MTKRPQTYKDLDVYLLSKSLAVRLHKITIDKLPRYEMYEERSQARRSSKSVVSNIVEGFGRRRYKNEFIQFLTYAIASCDETKVHIDLLYETGSLKEELLDELMRGYEELGGKLFNFRKAIIRNHIVS